MGPGSQAVSIQIQFTCPLSAGENYDTCVSVVSVFRLVHTRCCYILGFSLLTASLSSTHQVPSACPAGPVHPPPSRTQTAAGPLPTPRLCSSGLRPFWKVQKPPLSSLESGSPFPWPSRLKGGGAGLNLILFQPWKLLPACDRPPTPPPPLGSLWPWRGTSLHLSRSLPLSLFTASVCDPACHLAPHPQGRRPPGPAMSRQEMGTHSPPCGGVRAAPWFPLSPLFPGGHLCSL